MSVITGQGRRATSKAKARVWCPRCRGMGEIARGKGAPATCPQCKGERTVRTTSRKTESSEAPADDREEGSDDHEPEAPPPARKKTRKAAKSGHRPTKGKGRAVRHGGRKPGTWQFGLTAEKIRAWRTQHSVSRKVLAQRLGVSSTSIQNWENGICPIRRTQQSLAEIMEGGAPAPAVTEERACLPTGQRAGQGLESEAAIRATSEIVSSFLARGLKGVTLKSLPGFVSEIRRALL